MNHRSDDLRPGLICGLVVIVCILIARPFVETAILDDFSYYKTAQAFADTGHFVYNGWATAILGWLIPWGALFLKIFGASFVAVRLSIYPLAFGCVVLFYLCAVRFGIRTFNAVLGSMILGLSPLFLPLASCFMTDIPGLFVLLLCAYLCQRALLSSSATEAIVWFCIAAATNVVGGTVRQIAWLGALAMVPSSGWLLRKRRGILPVSIVLWIASVASIFLAIHWFNHQPYSVPEHIYIPQSWIVLRQLVRGFWHYFLCLGLISTPVMIAWTPFIFRLQGSRKKFFWSALALGLLLFAVDFYKMHNSALMPWLWSTIDNQGVWPIPDLLGSVPTTLGTGLRIALSVIVIFTWTAFLAQIKQPLSNLSTLREPSPTSTSGELSWSTMIWMLVPFLVAHLLLLIPRAITSQLFDRYLLGMMPFVLMLLLRAYQQQVAARLPALTIVTLCIFSIYAIASLHDWFAAVRAQLATLNRIQANGVPRSEIEAGWQLDGLAQVNIAGHINGPLIKVPKSAYHPLPPERRPPGCSNQFYEGTPAITPRYVLTVSPLSCFSDSQFPPTHFRSWLPPFEHAIYIQKVPPEEQ